MSQLHRIALSMLRCLSPQNARLLLEEVKTAEAVFDLEVLKEIPGLNPRLPEEVATGAALRQAERELDFMANSGVSLHWFEDENYPARLRTCPFYSSCTDTSALHKQGRSISSATDNYASLLFIA
jgi:DNA processing protein